MIQKGVRIEPAEGKLGVLLVGLGAVATTFIAGVEAVKQGLGKPIGSVTQMGTIRLGKRTDNRVPRIKDFVPLAKLDDLVFGGWDIFPDDAYDAAGEANVLERSLLDPLRPALEAIRPMKAVFDPALRQAAAWDLDQGRHQVGARPPAHGRHRGRSSTSVASTAR